MPAKRIWWATFTSLRIASNLLYSCIFHGCHPYDWYNYSYFVTRVNLSRIILHCFSPLYFHDIFLSVSIHFSVRIYPLILYFLRFYLHISKRNCSLKGHLRDNFVFNEENANKRSPHNGVPILLVVTSEILSLILFVYFAKRKKKRTIRLRVTFATISSRRGKLIIFIEIANKRRRHNGLEENTVHMFAGMNFTVGPCVVAK